MHEMSWLWIAIAAKQFKKLSSVCLFAVRELQLKPEAIIQWNSHKLFKALSIPNFHGFFHL